MSAHNLHVERMAAARLRGLQGARSRSRQAWQGRSCHPAGGDRAAGDHAGHGETDRASCRVLQGTAQAAGRFGAVGDAGSIRHHVRGPVRLQEVPGGLTGKVESGGCMTPVTDVAAERPIVSRPRRPFSECAECIDIQPSAAGRTPATQSLIGSIPRRPPKARRRRTSAARSKLTTTSRRPWCRRLALERRRKREPPGRLRAGGMNDKLQGGQVPPIREK